MLINRKPLLSIWLDRLASAGFGPFIINGHYKHEKIKDFIINNKHKKNINFFVEKKILGTAGTLIRHLDFLEKGGLLVHADNLCLADFNKFYLAHTNRPKSCLMTMMTFNVSNPKLFGIVKVDSNNIVKEFHEKDPNAVGNIANAAIYLLSEEIIKDIRKNFSHCKDFSTEILPSFMNRVFTYHTKEPLIDIGTPEDYYRAIEIERDYANKK